MNLLSAFPSHPSVLKIRAVGACRCFRRRKSSRLPALVVLPLVCLLLVFTGARSAQQADSPAATPAAAVNDTLAGDSLSPGLESKPSKKDSILDYLRRSGSSGPLELTYHRPDTILSLRNISYTLIVLALLIIFLHFLRKFVQRPISGVSPGEHFRVLQQFHLGPKKSIALVKLFDRLLLLGVTETSITTLSEISDVEEVERLLARLKDSGGGQAPNFREIYQGLLSRIKK